MAYWKFIKPEQLAAWDAKAQNEAKLREEGESLAAIFGGKPVFKGDITRTYFHGVKFGSAPFYVAKELWTVPKSDNGYSSWPKARPPKGMGEQHKSLKKLWADNYPQTRVSTDDFLKSIGFDWGMLLLYGITYFRVGDAIFVKTGAKPNEDAKAVEILGSEFDSAKREYVDAASA